MDKTQIHTSFDLLTGKQLTTDNGHTTINMFLSGIKYE